MKIKIKKINKNAIIPTRGSEKAGGYDLYACSLPENMNYISNIDEEFKPCINPHQTKKIGTGIAFEIPDGYVGLIFARSGIATKRGLRPANCVGVLDSDYRGELFVALHNDSNEPQLVDIGERIAQIVIVPFLSAEFEEVDSLSDTDRGNGGFGSTGKL